MNNDRRQFLKASGLSISVLSLTGASLFLSPSEAKAQKVAFKVLDNSEAQLLEAICEVMLPGATKAGVAYFIDEQLAKPYEDNLLMARYLQVEPPMANFYKGALAVFAGYCQQTQGKAFTKLAPAKQKQLIQELFKMGPHGPQNPDGWQGPPAFLVYLSFRSDAVDVVYGTMEGFEKLGTPYLAHIEPVHKW
jgi:hypothetical protein